jgi:hypothetical protein
MKIPETTNGRAIPLHNFSKLKVKEDITFLL